jgi:hypothetical protein
VTTHADLVLAAATWLRSKTGGRCTRVFAEMVCPGTQGEIADAIGFGSVGYGYQSHVIECKTSRADFARDPKKLWRRCGRKGMGRFRYYLAPPGLLTAADMPEGCGLLELRGSRVVAMVDAKPRDEWDAEAEAGLLLSVVRRLELGVRHDRRTGRWERYDDHKTRTVETVNSPEERR